MVNSRIKIKPVFLLFILLSFQNLARYFLPPFNSNVMSYTNIKPVKINSDRNNFILSYFTPHQS